MTKEEASRLLGEVWNALSEYYEADENLDEDKADIQYRNVLKIDAFIRGMDDGRKV